MKVPHLDSNHQANRVVVRNIGLVLLIVGVIFTAIGMISFFSFFGSFGSSPKYFWCCFVGMPVAPR